MNENSKENDIAPRFSSPQEGLPKPGEPAEPPYVYRRRRRKGDRHDGGERSRLSKLMGRSKGGGRLSTHQRGERFLVVGCVLLGFVAVGFFGFLTGQKNERAHQTPALPPEVEEILPSPEEEGLLDRAFGEMGDGNYRKALLDFQKIHDAQPALSGIDYLIGTTALRLGENELAEEALQRSLGNKEMEGESRVLLDIIGLRKATGPHGGEHQLVDPLESAENSFKRYAASRPSDAKIYAQWAEVLRSRGSFRSAEALFHKGILRADPSSSESLLSGKEILTRIQDQPTKEVPSLSELTSMSGDQALGAALGALQHQQNREALQFLKRASEFYTPRTFRELMNDCAFDQYRTEPDMQKFLKAVQSDVSDAGSQ